MYSIIIISNILFKKNKIYKYGYKPINLRY